MPMIGTAGFAQVARPLGRRDDDADAAVADQAAVEQAQRLDDPARRLVILDRDRLAHHGLWIQRSVMPARDGHLSRADAIVVPYSAMCRLADTAELAAAENMPQMPHESPHPYEPAKRELPVLAASPNTQAT